MEDEEAGVTEGGRDGGREEGRASGLFPELSGIPAGLARGSRDSICGA